MDITSYLNRLQQRVNQMSEEELRPSRVFNRVKTRFPDARLVERRRGCGENRVEWNIDEWTIVVRGNTTWAKQLEGENAYPENEKTENLD